MSAGFEDWRTILQREFDSDAGSFIATLRDESHWDRDLFRELVVAMRDCCLFSAEETQFDRWVALGFFYVPAFVRAWTQQADFPRPPVPYWRRAIELLEELSHWFFWGECPCDDGDVDFGLVLSN